VTVFYVLGALTAVWAVVLAGLGIRQHRFPATPQATRVVIAISLTMFAGAIGSAIISGALEGDEEEEAEATASEEAEAQEEEEAVGEAAPGGGQELELSAVESGDFAFDTTELQARSGSVTLTMENPSPVEHNVSLERSGVDEEGETVGQGETSTVTAEVEPGDYTFYCSVPGHREGGMEGTLTVE
jgi:plastocyanin